MPMLNGPYIILACSPRKGGNTDRAAEIFAEGFAAGLAEPGEAAVELHYLRDYRVSPCIDCNNCGAFAASLAGRCPSLSELASGPPGVAGSAPFGCPLARKDDSAALLRLLTKAPGLCVVSPIYFYHLPAQLKALLDRTQPFWRFAEADFTIFAGRSRRPCRVILAGARSSGKRLFEGSLLTLACAFNGLHADIVEPLTLYGLDRPKDIAGKDATAMRERLLAYGKGAGRAHAGAGIGAETETGMCL